MRLVRKDFCHIKHFSDVTPDLQSLAGGKGGALASMFRKGYPVPEGFVVFPSAFRGERLCPEAWNEVRASLDALRKKEEETAFALRLHTAEAVGFLGS